MFVITSHNVPIKRDEDPLSGSLLLRKYLSDRLLVETYIHFYRCNGAEVGRTFAFRSYRIFFVYLIIIKILFYVRHNVFVT